MLRLFSQMYRAGWLAAGALCLAACSAPDASWQHLWPQGFPLTNHDASALLFLDDSTGLLLGSAWSESAALTHAIPTEQVSTVFRTTDGGRTWQLKVMGKGRRFTQATRVGRTAYALELREDTARIPRDTTQLLRSTDGGRSWQRLGRVPDYVLTVSFADTSRGFLVTSGQWRRQMLYRTTDGGRSWQPARLRQEIPVLSGVATADDRAWLLLPPPEHQPGYLAAFLARVDWRTGAVAVEAIPGGLVEEPPVLDDAGNLWLAGSRADSSARLLRREARTGRYTEVHRFAPNAGQELRPVVLHLSGRSLSLLVSVGPEQRVYRFFYSPDLGRSWREERLPIVPIRPPFAFFGPEHAWLSVDSAQLLARKSRH